MWKEARNEIAQEISWLLFIQRSFLAVWPDLAKFCHFGEILQYVAKDFELLFSIWRNPEPTSAICCAIGQIFIVLNGQNWQHDMAIWCGSMSAGDPNKTHKGGSGFLKNVLSASGDQTWEALVIVTWKWTLDLSAFRLQYPFVYQEDEPLQTKEYERPTTHRILNYFSSKNLIVCYCCCCCCLLLLLLFVWSNFLRSRIPVSELPRLNSIKQQQNWQKRAGALV